ncbi:beta-lactamase [Colletotrichum karsti]|uniref:Beta-lactamase n=1 Tax=Colletotrichum karsti TaxID=1095194 RepID=A0A9P6IH35_9PEZI|nr:beta-lactamase [Colletotrichum karsti]KAF9882502.1 beta-lactamase [Colletotrichum karsti]
MRYTSSLGLLASASVAVGAIAPPAAEVPLIGPSFLSNFDPTDSQYIRNASESFPAVIDALFESGALNKTDLELVFSVDVFSAATNKSLYSYYHVGEEGKKGLTKGNLDDETVQRTGSVSKLFTAYALIAAAGIEVFSHPVTRYIPELLGNSSGDPLSNVRWEDITVGALASHQAGSGGAVVAVDPRFNVTDAARLGNLTAQDLFAYMRDFKHPTISPYRSALYSDGGYSLLGQVLARLSGQTYGDALRDTVLKPLGLNGTSVTAPEGPDVNANNRFLLHSNDSSWGQPLPYAQGSGGVYSNAADLRALGLSILNSEILSAAETSSWMKPLSSTGSLVELVGAPWEISRLAIPVSHGSNVTRISDLYTKAGGTGDYTCIFALSPDHGIGFSILVGGDSATDARWPIRNALGELFIPAAEAAAAENTERNLAGFFEASEGSNVTLTFDDDHPGLGIGSMYLEGTLVMPTDESKSLRLYPTGLYSNTRSLSALYNTKGTFRTTYRSVTTTPYPRAASEGGAGGLFDDQHSWLNVGFLDTSDELIFTIEDGKLTCVEYKDFILGQVTFKRVE